MNDRKIMVKKGDNCLTKQIVCAMLQQLIYLIMEEEFES